jgi:hypothetical protein
VGGEGDNVRLRVSGRWLVDSRPDEHEALLVIQLQGRRHRFPATREPADASPPPGTWRAEFTIPSWAVPSRPGQAAVWVGNAVVGVGPPGAPPSKPPPGLPPTSEPVAPGAPPAASPKPPEAASPKPAEAAPAPPPIAPPPPASAPPPPAAAPPPPAAAPPLPASAAARAPSAPAPAEGPPDPGRAGPLADLLFKESVSALHAELERRSGEVAHLRGALADAQSELDARAARQAGLELAHAELRHELEQLMDVAARQREDFDKRLGVVHEELDMAREQAAMAAAARDDAGAQLAQARERAGSFELELAAHGDAVRRQAQDVSALREQLAAAQVSRDAAISEAGGLRAELERLGAELTVMREQVTAHGGDLGEAQRLLADARALTEQLRRQSDE